MAKEEKIIKDGLVVKSQPNGRFTVQLIGNGLEILAHISGSIRKNNIRIMENDHVRVALSSYDLTKGIIKYRYSPTEWEKKQEDGE